MSDDRLEDMKAALKKAGRGGWRVDLKAISEAASKSLEENKEKVLRALNTKDKDV